MISSVYVSGTQTLYLAFNLTVVILCVDSVILILRLVFRLASSLSARFLFFFLPPRLFWYMGECSEDARN